MDEFQNLGDAAAAPAGAPLTRHQKILIGAGPKAFGADFTLDKKRFTDENLFIRKQILSIAGGQVIVDSNSKQADGICSFVLGQVPAGINMLCAGISCKLAMDTNKSAIVDIQQFKALIATADGGIRNAEIEITVDGKLMPRVRVIDLLGDGDTDVSQGIGRNSIMWLQNGYTLKEGAQIIIKLLGPAAGTLNTLTYTYFLEIGLHGPGFRDK